MAKKVFKTHFSSDASTALCGTTSKISLPLTGNPGETTCQICLQTLRVQAQDHDAPKETAFDALHSLDYQDARTVPLSAEDIGHLIETQSSEIETVATVLQIPLSQAQRIVAEQAEYAAKEQAYLVAKKLDKMLVRDFVAPTAVVTPKNREASDINSLVHLDPYKVIIKPGFNPRTVFPQAIIETLARQIAEEGQKQPITVYKENGDYIILNGELRTRAFRWGIETGLMPADKAIAAIVSTKGNVGETGYLFDAIIQNQGTPLCEMDEARAFYRLYHELGTPLEVIARKCGYSREFVRKRLELMQLNPAIQQELAQGQVTLALVSKVLQVAKDKAVSQLAALAAVRDSQVDKRTASGKANAEEAARLAAEKKEAEQAESTRLHNLSLVVASGICLASTPKAVQTYAKAHKSALQALSIYGSSSPSLVKWAKDYFAQHNLPVPAPVNLATATTITTDDESLEDESLKDESLDEAATLEGDETLEDDETLEGESLEDESLEDDETLEGASPKTREKNTDRYAGHLANGGKPPTVYQSIAGDINYLITREVKRNNPEYLEQIMLACMRICQVQYVRAAFETASAIVAEEEKAARVAEMSERINGAHKMAQSTVAKRSAIAPGIDVSSLAGV